MPSGSDRRFGWQHASTGGPRERPGGPAGSNRALLHGFEEGALHFRGGPVDLVCQHQVGEHRAGLEEWKRLPATRPTSG